MANSPNSKRETMLGCITLVITLLLGAGLLWGAQNGLRSLLGNSPPPSDSAPASNSASTAAIASTSTIAAVPNVPDRLTTYGGSTTWAAIRAEMTPLVAQAFPKFQLRYVDPSNSKPSTEAGIAMLLEGQLDFSLASRPIQDGEIQRAQQRGIKLKQIPVAIDGIAVVVNPSLQIPGLTFAQFEAILANKLTNWREVGGPDLPIALYHNANRFSTFQATKFTNLSSTTEALRRVAADPGGMHWASASLVVSQCGVRPLPIGRTADRLIPPYVEPLSANCAAQPNRVNVSVFRDGSYPVELSRKLFVIIRENGGFEQQAGEAYANMLLSNEGQTLLEQLGLVRLQ